MALLISSILADGPSAGADGPDADVNLIGTLYNLWNDAPRPGTKGNFNAMWRTSGACSRSSAFWWVGDQTPSGSVVEIALCHSP